MVQTSLATNCESPTSLICNITFKIPNEYYNSQIKINNKIKCEKLFRLDHTYDCLIVINYNVKNTKPYKGSAIFIHLTKNYKKTLGCIALKKKDFLILAKLINKKTKIKIH